MTALAKAKQLHGVLMLLGWGVLLPVGVLMARYLKWKGPLWLKLHIGLQASRRARAYIDRPNPRADRVLRRRPSVVQTEALAYPFHPRPRPRRQYTRTPRLPPAPPAPPVHHLPYSTPRTPRTPYPEPPSTSRTAADLRPRVRPRGPHSRPRAVRPARRLVRRPQPDGFARQCPRSAAAAQVTTA